MGQEQGSYIDGDSGADFTYGYGGGGDEVSIGLDGGGVDFGDADFFYGYGTGGGVDLGTGAEYGDSGYSPGGDLYGAYVDYYTNQGFDLTTAMEFAAQDAAQGSIETITSEQGLLPDIWNQPFYDLPYIPDPFLTPYTPIFPDLPPPLPPIVTPTFPLVAPPVPQVTQTPTIPGSGQIPKAPGLPPACPTGQYHPYPIGHPDQNKCVPFPPAQTGSPPQQPPRQTAPAPVPAPKPPEACPTGYCKHPTTGQCIPIPSGYTRHPQTQICTLAQQQQQQKCPTGYYPTSTGQCLPIPRCTTPGTVFDAARGICVPKDQAISPVSEDGVFGDLFENLKELPWWIWLALGGLILLSRDSDGKKTTVTYRRAR